MIYTHTYIEKMPSEASRVLIARPSTSQKKKSKRRGKKKSRSKKDTGPILKVGSKTALFSVIQK